MRSALYALPSFSGFVLSLAVAAYAWRSRQGPAWSYLMALGLAVAWWCAGQFAWALVPGADGRRLLGQLQYVGIAATPVCWLLTALAATGHRRWLSRRRIAAVAAIPAATVMLAATNAWHGLVWQRFDPVPGLLRVDVDYGPWFVVHTSYCYGLVVLGVVVLAARFSTSPAYRGPLVVALGAPTVVLVASLLHLAVRTRLPIDPTPTAFAVAMACFAWAIRRYRMLEVLPLARRITLERLSEGVLVLDDNGRIVDANPAARRLLDPARLTPGEPAPPELDGVRECGPGQSSEVHMASGLRLQLRASPVARDDGDEGGRIVVVRDVTDERLAQERLLEAQRQLTALNRELEQLANADALTGLASRRHFFARLRDECERARRHHRAVSVLLVDLDHFKRVNDTHGHQAGDRVLEAVGRALLALLRPFDVAGRCGGEELAVLLPETDLDGAATAARRYAAALGALSHAAPSGATLHVTVSIGVAALGHGEAPDDLIARADQALYHAKATGRDGVARWHEGQCERLVEMTAP
ncbi:MAG: diguanylate cyclase [Acidobacteria bacterium]|nr:diguanylate cyclase [Acidobacteriota bacterium]